MVDHCYCQAGLEPSHLGRHTSFHVRTSNMSGRKKLCKHAPPRSESDSDEDMLIPLSVYMRAGIGSALQDK